MTAAPAAAAPKRKTRARPLAHEVAEAAHRQLKSTAVLAAFFLGSAPADAALPTAWCAWWVSC